MKILKSTFFIYLIILLIFITSCSPNRINHVKTNISIFPKLETNKLIVEGETNLPHNTTLTVKVFIKNNDNSSKLIAIDEVNVDKGSYFYFYDISNYSLKNSESSSFIIGIEYNPEINDKYTYEYVGAQFNVDFADSNNSYSDIYIDVKSQSTVDRIILEGNTNLPDKSVLQLILMPNTVTKQETIEEKLIVKDGYFKFKYENINKNHTPEILTYTIHFKFTDSNYEQPENVKQLFGNKGEKLKEKSPDVSLLDDGSYVLTKIGTFFWPNEFAYKNHLENENFEKTKAFLTDYLDKIFSPLTLPIKSFDVYGAKHTGLKVAIIDKEWNELTLNNKYDFCEFILKIFNMAREEAELEYDKNTRIKIISEKGIELVPFFSNTYKMIEE